MYLYFFPLIAAVTGWLCNIFFLNYLFGRIIPARVPGIAAKAGSYVSDKVFNMDLITAKLTDPASLEEMKPFIEGHIDVFLKIKLKEKMPAIAMFVGDKTLDSMKNSLMEEIDILLPGLLQKYARNLGEKVNIEKIISDKLNALPEGRLTELLMNGTKKERRLFQLSGAVSGFLIGATLVFLVIAFRP